MQMGGALVTLRPAQWKAKAIRYIASYGFSSTLMQFSLRWWKMS
jgi:hypothetical protein